MKLINEAMGPFNCYNADGGGEGGVKFSGKKHYEGVRFNVISITRGCVGVQFLGKKHYVTLEWPLDVEVIIIIIINYY